MREELKIATNLVENQPQGTPSGTYPELGYEPFKRSKKLIEHIT